MSANDICDDASDSGGSAVAELNRALANNPELRGKTPPPTQEEWEDFEKLLAENPELAAPVPSSAPNASAVYYSMDVWPCKHESEPYKTSIERVPHDDEQDGVNPATGEFYEDALLINHMPSICPDCIRKWTVPEDSDAGEPTSSKDPSELPVAEPLPRCVLDIDDGGGEVPVLDQAMNELQIDDGPDKNKGPVGQDLAPEYDNDYASDYSECSLPHGDLPLADYDQVYDVDAANNGAPPAAGGPPPY